MGGALLEAAARGELALCAATLAADARAVHYTDELGRTALQLAAAEGHVEVVQLLLRHGADPNSQDYVYGNTAAHEAAWKGYSRCVRALAAAGAVLSAPNAAGFTPLHFAAQNGHNQSCRELLLAGAPPDLQNTYGDTALHTAARYGHAGAARILLSGGARAAPNRNGDSPLHIAAAMARRKLTRLLLRAGCEPRLRNRQAETARDIAKRKGLADVVRIFDSPGPKRRKRDGSGERALREPASGTKKKKNVRFEKPQVQWSPYGCHYYPDPELFPEPRLSSLPAEPLRKGEQYYLDLAGNIKKGPVGAGFACYCAPFFKHMEDKLDEDKRDLKRHIDRAHERLDQKVTDLEMKTRGRISELTRFVAAERALCKERHEHLEHWLARGMMFRASERVRRQDRASGASVDVPPLKRTRSLEVLDTDERNRVHGIIKSFKENCDQYDGHAKDLDESKATSKSADVLFRRSPSPRRRPPPARPAPVELAREPGPSWRSRCLQRTADDIRKRAELDKEMSELLNGDGSKSLDISQDGYVRLRKRRVEEEVETERRKSVQELVARAERAASPARGPDAPPPAAPPPPGILKTPQQPTRPAPALRDKPPKSRRFSLHNLIPFPTRKTFRPAAGPAGAAAARSESSEEEAEAEAEAPPADAYFHELPGGRGPRSRAPLAAAEGELLSRLRWLALAPRAPDLHSHNDSGYSTKVYGSSQGPSPSLSGPSPSLSGLSPGLSGPSPGLAGQPGGCHLPPPGHLAASSLV